MKASKPMIGFSVWCHGDRNNKVMEREREMMRLRDKREMYFVVEREMAQGGEMR